ncbi:hypothetical protein ABLN87_15140 [Ruegeria sp. SCPT10]|uniref:hypothetical protein n=1 Tax=Ruegeria sp. SCP10 TaxID=3141377 RepID=UPI00333944F0
MPDLTDFQSNLSKLATCRFPFLNGRLPLEAADPMAAMLREIENAVLGTTLRFVSDENILELQVTGRRVVLVSDCSNLGFQGIIDQAPIVNSDDIVNLMVSFTDAIGPTSDFALIPGPLRSDLYGVSGMVSVTAIRQGILSVANSIDHGSMLDVVVRRLQNLTLASLQFGMERAEHANGPEGLLSDLRDFRQNRLEQLLSVERLVAPQVPEPDLTVLSDTIGAGVCVGLIRWDTELALIAFDVASLFDVLKEFEDKHKTEC